MMAKRSRIYERYILSHNLGTTGDKAVIYDEQGRIVRSWLTPYASVYSNGNRVEQDPSDWWSAFCDATKNVLRGINEKSLEVVTFSGQMMGCLCLDKAGEPIGNSIIWADMRAEREAKALNDVIDERQFFRITGHRISPSYTLAKLLWVKNNQPDVYRRTAKVVQAKDYIVFRLTGSILTDYTDASGTNMFNLSKRTWSKTLLAITGISRDLLPDAVPSTEIAGKVTMDAAAATGLLPGTPVVIGSGDGLSTTVGAGCTTEQDAYLYFGSSSWIGLTKREPYCDPALRTFNWNHIVPDLVGPCGTMQAAGSSLDWMREEMARSETAQAEVQGCKAQDLIDYEVLQSPPGANGLLFLPYLLGERSPYWSPSAKGAFLGLRKKHSRADMFRATVEGVVMNLKIIWNIFKPIMEAEELVVLGGQASSDVNTQLVADILGIKVVSHNHLRDSKNFGAAVIGGIGIGMYPELDHVKNLLHVEKRFEPDGNNTRFYNRLLPVFEDSFAALSCINGRLDSVRGACGEEESV